MRMALYFRMTREAWLKSMTSRQYAELVAFSRLEPLGLEREDARHALAAVHLCGAMNGKPPAIENVMLVWQPPVEQQTNDELFNVMQLLPKAEPINGDDSKS